jgi:hypothetical protein
MEILEPAVEGAKNRFCGADLASLVPPERHTDAKVSKGRADG